jgi:secreted trypsin-like serine protease
MVSVEFISRDLIVNVLWKKYFSKKKEDFSLPGDHTDSVHNGDEVVAAGWGTYAEDYDNEKYTLDHLQQIRLTVLDPYSAQCNTGEIGDKWDKPNIICAHKRSKPSGTCFGDSGGPVLVYRNKRWILIGVISFGHFIKDETSKYLKLKCDASKPSYFVKVSSYLDWIYNHLSIAQATKKPKSSTTITTLSKSHAPK